MRFQKDGRMAEVPLILGKIEKLKKPKYGAHVCAVGHGASGVQDARAGEEARL